jgi:hypothetical protein
MKNPKVRFSLEETGTIFCYVTSQSLPANGIYATENGTCYDMEILKQLLEKDQFTDEAIVGRVPATGECHWVFEGDLVNEVTAQEGDRGSLRDALAAATAANTAIREENEKLKAANQVLASDKEAILGDHAQLVQKLTEERERNANVQSIEQIPAEQLASELARRPDLDALVAAARNTPAPVSVEPRPSDPETREAVAEALGAQDATPQKEATDQPS